MAHDLHFLSRLSRVDEEQTRRALELYHNANLVRGLLQTAQLENAERVALPISEDEDPPHLIVARNGHFVTCLGAGMKLGNAPVVPWSLVRRGLDEQHATEALQTTRLSEVVGKFERLFVGGADVAREDMSPVCLIAPLIRKEWFLDWLKTMKGYAPTVGRLQRRVAKHRAKADELEDLWLLRWQLAHHLVTLLVADPEGEWLRRGDPKLGFIHLLLDSDGVLGGFMPTAARYLWAASQLGEPGVPVLTELRNNAQFPGQAGMAGLALAVLAIRHPELRKPIRATLAAPASRPDEHWDGCINWEDVLRCESQLLALLEAPRSTWDVFQHKAGAWALEQLRHRVGARADEFPAESLLALALAVAVPGQSPSAWLTGLVGFVPALAQATALDLYLPRTWMPPVRFHPEWMEALLRRAVDVDLEPQRAEPKPGRNDPCPCGSGKKSKRCCAA